MYSNSATRGYGQEEGIQRRAYLSDSEVGGFVNLAAIGEATGESGAAEGDKGYAHQEPSASPLPPTSDAVVMTQPGSMGSENALWRPPNIESPPRYSLWIWLSVGQLLCCGVIPGLVSLVIFWQSSFDWEQGKRDDARRSLLQGKIVFFIGAVMGIGAWAGLIYYIHYTTTLVSYEYRYP